MAAILSRPQCVKWDYIVSWMSSQVASDGRKITDGLRLSDKLKSDVKLFHGYS